MGKTCSKGTGDVKGQWRRLPFALSRRDQVITLAARKSFPRTLSRKSAAAEKEIRKPAVHHRGHGEENKIDSSIRSVALAVAKNSLQPSWKML
jgi:hypothetical protein